MKIAVLLCFVGAFLLDPTLGIIWFSSNDPDRTAEYEDSDARTLFQLISLDLRTPNRSVTIVAPPAAFMPTSDSDIEFMVDLQGPYFNGINERTGLQNRYSFNGHLYHLDVMQGVIHVLRSETVEELHEGVSSLSVDMTIQIEEIHMQSRVTYDARWRGARWTTTGGYFGTRWRNIELRYQTRFQLLREGRSQLIGRLMGDPGIAINRVNVDFVDVSLGNNGTLFNWTPSDFGENGQIDHLIRSTMPRLMSEVVDVVDTLVRAAIGNRPYEAPMVSLLVAAAGMSGYSCRRPPPRSRRATKLYN